MTQSERDREIRDMRDRLATTNEECAATFNRLRRYCTMFRDLAMICDGVIRDHAERTREQSIPDGLPSTEDLRTLLAELRACTTTIEELKAWLRQAGYPVA